MEWKFVIFVAAFSFAHASEVIDKLYKDALGDISDPDLNALDGKLLICRDRVCNRLCRILRFERGSCDNCKCKCFKEESMAYEYTDVEELNKIVNEDEENDTPDLENIMDPKSCNSNVCTQRCKQLGYKYGICRNRRCFCSRGKNAEEFLTDEYTEVEELYMIVNEDEESDTLELENIMDPKSCNSNSCNQRCKQLGYKYGICRNRRCFCSRGKNAEEFLTDEYTEVEELNMITSEDEERDTPDLDNIMNTKSCNSNVCTQRCKQLGYKYGICRNKRCFCSRGKNAEDTYDSALEGPDSRFLVCNDRACDRLCKTLRFGGGSCVNGKCKCIKNDAVNDPEKFSLQQAEYNESGDTEMILNDDEVIDLQERASCKKYECNSNCIDSGHKGGRCYRKKCRCF